MSYFFSGQNLASGMEINMAGEEARHILLSRRAKAGQRLHLQDPAGLRFVAEILGEDKKTVKFKILSPAAVPPEPSVRVILFLSVISEAALDFVLQKGTELGLGKLVLFNSANTATKLSQNVFEKKKNRWGKIVKEAAKQSDRASWPQISFLPGLAQVKQELFNYDKIILFDSAGAKPASVKIGPELKSVAMIVGPEGGLITEEVVLFKTLPSVESIALGPVLLRADTACLVGLAVIRMLTN